MNAPDSFTSKPLVYTRLNEIAEAAPMSAGTRTRLRALAWEVQAYESALFAIMAVFHGNPGKYMEAAEEASRIADKVLENLDRPAVETTGDRHGS